MIALLWKELRENLKWAVLAMLALGVAEFAALLSGANDGGNYYQQGITLCRESFLIVTMFGSAAVGLLLGLVQILPELKRDRWAALLHRPVPRGRLFLGKAVAGVILYGVAAVLPFLACLWYTAAPGHFATPFVPGLALAGLADTCAGLVYYFAALLVALQRGGAIGLRALPLLAAAHLTFFVVGATSFGDAVWAAGLMAGALGGAAWGAMHHRESFAARPWPGRLALLVVAFYGLCGLADFAGFVSKAGNIYDFNGADYELSDAGRPLKLSYRQGAVVSVAELDGSVPPEANYKPDRVREHLRYLNSCCTYIGSDHGWHPYWEGNSYRSTNTYLYLSSQYSRPQPEQWFRLLKERTVIGMSPLGKVAIARLDARGFQPASATPVPFPDDVTVQSSGDEGYRLWTPDSLRFVDLPRRQITNIPLPTPGPIYGVTIAWAPSATGTVRATPVALATAAAVYNDKDGRLLATLPYHQDMDHWGYVRIGISSSLDRFYLRYEPSAWIPRKERQGIPSYVEEWNAQGQVLHSYTLPPLPDYPEPPSWVYHLNRRLQSPAFFFGTLLYQKAGAMLGSARLQDALAERIGDHWMETRQTATYTLLFSFLSTVATFYGARRAHFSSRRAWLWTGLAFAFNVAGLLTFRLVADWPRLIPCPACRRPRPIDQPSCPHCADGWPATQPTGAEIFDHSEPIAQESAASA